MDGDTVASPAEAWSPNELQSIARTDDFHMHPSRDRCASTNAKEY